VAGRALGVGDDVAVERGEHEDVGVHAGAMVLEHGRRGGVIGGGDRGLQREVAGQEARGGHELLGAHVQLPREQRAGQAQLLFHGLPGARPHERADRDVPGRLDQREQSEEHHHQPAAEAAKAHAPHRKLDATGLAAVRQAPCGESALERVSP
jgi:hypothetical protein